MSMTVDMRCLATSAQSDGTTAYVLLQEETSISIYTIDFSASQYSEDSAELESESRLRR